MTAPNPTASPSKDNANANDAASNGDSIREESLSASCGLAYIFSIKFRFSMENFNSLETSLRVLINRFIVLSNIFINPKHIRIVKQSILVTSSCIYPRKIVPTSKDTPRIQLHIRFIVITDENGILILLLPYAKLATNESVDSTSTIRSASKAGENVLDK